MYQQIDNAPNLTLAEKYEQKMQVLGATFEAGDAYTSAFEDLASYTRIARETGDLFLPGFGKKLEEFETRLAEATDNRAFKAFGQVKTASDYVSKAVGLVSAADEILNDRNLTPASRRSLLALRGLGETMQAFGGKVPGLGAGLEMYGQLVAELTGAVRQAAANITVLKGGSFSLDEQRDLGLGPGYVRTPLYDQGLNVVQEHEGDGVLVKVVFAGFTDSFVVTTGVFPAEAFAAGEAVFDRVVGSLRVPRSRTP